MASSGSDEFVGIRDDPDVSRSTLRFGVGNLVIYKDKDRHGWFEGEVVKVAQRLELSPQSSKFIHYIVWPNVEDVDGTVWVEGDTDDVIRPRPIDLTPDPDKFKPFLTPPEDPLSYLYTGLTNNPYTPDGENMAEQFRRLSRVHQARPKPDGSVLRNTTSGRTISVSNFEIPNPICGVPGLQVLQFGRLWHTRRHIHSQTTKGMLDFVGVFKSALNFEERSLEQLEQAARTSNDKMLQLGDALLTGVHGFPRNPTRARNCYHAAGMGCQETELLQETAGMAIGNPEAMVASAMFFITYIQCNEMRLDLMEDVSYSRLLLHTIQIPGGMDLLDRMIWWTTNSVRRKSVSSTMTKKRTS